MAGNPEIPSAMILAPLVDQPVLPTHYSRGRALALCAVDVVQVHTHRGIGRQIVMFGRRINPGSILQAVVAAAGRTTDACVRQGLR